MGVTNLIKLITKHAGKAAMKKYPLEKFSGMVVAVDASLMIYKTVLAVRATGVDITNRKGELTSHLQGILTKIVKLLEHNITPIFVFDGKPPDIKKKTSEVRDAKRLKAKNNLTEMAPDSADFIKNFKDEYKPTAEQTAELQIMLDIIGIPYILAPGEADVVCAWLASRSDENGQRYVKGVCSDDSDMLAFGAKYLFKDMSVFMKNTSQITVVSLHKALNKMNITMDQFVDLCALLGCDNCDNIPKIGAITAYKNICDHESLEKIIDLYKKKKFDHHKGFDFKQLIIARDYFKTAVTDIDSDIVKGKLKITGHNLKLRQIQFDTFMDFMCVKHNFDVLKIETIGEKLRELNTKMNVTRLNTECYHTLLQKISENYDILSSDSDTDSDSDSDTPVAKPATKSMIKSTNKSMIKSKSQLSKKT